MGQGAIITEIQLKGVLYMCASGVAKYGSW